MSEPVYNPMDPLFLASRAMDEALGEQEMRVLRAALAESAALRAEVEGLGRIGALVREFAQSGDASAVPADWIERVQARLRGADEGDSLLDALLAKFAAEQPDVAWGEFHRDVLARVRELSGVGGRRRWRVVRLAAPLAAAAVLAMAAGVFFWADSSTRIAVQVTEPPVEAVADVGGAVMDAPLAGGGRTEVVWRREELARQPHVTVHFVRRSPPAGPPYESNKAIGLAVVGSDAVIVGAEESPPL